MAFLSERTAEGWHVYDPENPAIDVTQADRATALDKAQAALAQYEATKRKPQTAPDKEEQTPSKPEQRRRWRRVPDWAINLEEDDWRLVDKEGYDAEAERIAAIKTAAPALETRYGFRDKYPIEVYGYERPFDLADTLIGLLHTYKLNKAMSPMKDRLDEHDRRVMEIRNTSSLANATTLEKVWLAVEGYRLYRDPDTGREKHDLQKAVRKLMGGHRKAGGGGLYLTPEATLCRGIAGTYHTGTGKGLATGTRGQLRGPYARFARECLALFNVRVTDATIRDQTHEMRHYFEKLGR